MNYRVTDCRQPLRRIASPRGIGKVSLVIAPLILIAVFLSLSHSVTAVNRTWDGGGLTNNWSEAANWSGDIVPGSGDIAIFDATSTKDVTIDTSISVGGIQITSGYSGTVTQAAGASVTVGSSDFSQAGGAFAGSNNNDAINVNGNFILSGGTFTSTKGTLTLAGDHYTHSSGGVFLHNSGTVTFAFVGSSPVVTLNGNETFNNLNFADSNADGRILFGTVVAQGALALIDGSFTSNGAVEAQAGVTIAPTFDGGDNTLLITTGDGSPRTITFAAGTNLQNVNLNAANVTINTSGSGTLTWKDVTLQAGTINQGAVDFVFAGNNNQVYNQNGGTFNGSANAITCNNFFTLSGGAFNGGSGNITINERFTINGGTFTSTSGTFFLAGNFQHSTGTFNHNNGTVTFTGSTSGVQLSPPVGGETFDNLNFNKSNGANISVFGHVTALGNLALNDGSVIGGPLNILEARAGVTIAPTFLGGSDTLSIANGGGIPRTITFAAGTNLLNISLSDPDVTINTSGSGVLNWQALTLQAGTINQGSLEFVFAGDNDQSGGTFNGSGNAITFNNFVTQTGGVFNGGSGNITMHERFTLSAGIFTSTSGTLFIVANFQHNTGGGTFNHNNGTVTFQSDLAGHNGSTIAVPDAANGGETFNNLNFSDQDAGNKFIFGTMIAVGAISFNDGFLTAGASGLLTRIEARGGVTVAPTFDGSNMNMFFSGPANQTFTNNGGPNPTGVWTIDKPAGTVTASSSVILSTSQQLNITEGRLYLNSGSNLTCGPLTIGDSVATAKVGKLVNDTSTTITLGDNVQVLNDSIVDFQGGGATCPDPDTILIRSSDSNTKRQWSGSGHIRLVDVDVQDQAGTASITVFSGTGTNGASPGGNGNNWHFDNSCPQILSISPLVVNLTTGGTQTFAAGGGFAPYTFSVAVNNSGATINSNSGFYTAGVTPDVTDTVRVTDAFGGTADAMVNLVGVAAKLGFIVQPGDTIAGAAISPAVKVAVQDANGFTITSSSAAVTIAIGNNPGSSTLSGTLTRNAVNGIATFDDLTLNRSGAGYTLIAQSAGLTLATSDGFNIAPGAAAQLVFVVQPHNADANAVISPPVQVAIEDSLGNTVTTATGPITIALHDNPGAGILSGTLMHSAVNGVAVFDDLSINRVANNYTLHANASGLPQVISASFNIGRPVLFVTNTNDSGAGSLRQAINDANNLFGADTIHFNITGTPPFTITPASALPTISESITIDGTSQTGFSGTPIIELSGANLANGSGLTLNGDSCTVKGLVINQFSIAISVQTSGNVIQGNYLGVDASGTAAKLTGTGINIIGLTTPTNNTIGGTTVAARNVIVGSSAGISIGNPNFGSDPTNSLIQGNFIGTNAAGTAALAGAASTGIVLNASNNTVGGTTAGARNLISGNGTGVKILGSFNTVQGNLVGTNLNGSSALGNSVSGIAVFGSDNLIGGSTPQAANTMAFNSNGVVVADAFGPAQRNAIRQNSIFSNTKLGIDLQTSGATGITGDDPGDGDSGANNQQNFPVLSSAISSAGSLVIQGTLNSKASSTYTLDFYSNQSCNGQGNGEGKTYLGSSTVNTDASGIVGFSANLSVNVAVGQVVTATATDSVGNTSEFSKCTIVSPSIVSISGHLSDSSNVALVNTLVVIGGTKTLQTVTNVLGNYSFINLPAAGTYTVTPVLTNYIFAPPSRNYSNLLTNQTNQNFVGTRNNLKISGTVKSQVQTTFSPLSGVTVTLSGASSATTTTDNNGSYSFKNLLAGSYTVTPGKPGFTMTPSSSPVTLTNGDKTANFTAQISLTGRIVFTGNGQLMAMNADGSGLVNLLTPFDFDPALSRDGQRIAFVQRTNNDVTSEEIFVANYDGSNVMRLTNNNLIDIQPAWSPDGTKIAFIRNTKTLMVMNADGTGQTSVPFPGNGQGVSNPSWSPDGSKIAFAMNVSGTNKVFRADYPSGSNLTELATNATVPDWSPDGTKIVFERNSNLLTMNADGSNQTQVIATVGSTEPIWSPDSSQFAYPHQNAVSGQIEVIVASADGTVKTVVNSSSSFVDKPGWSITPTASTATGSRPTGPVTVNLGGTSLTFSDVSASGTSTVLPIPPNSAGTLPDGFVIGNLAFEIATSATFTPPVTVCFTVPATTAATPTEFNKLFFMHNEGGLLVDRTTSRDFANRKICGVVDSLGSFTLAEQVDNALPSITGLVVDSNDNPISGVVVNLTGTETGVTETDSDGIFNFVNLTVNGNYNVEPKQIGFLFNAANQDFVNISDAQTVVFAGSTGSFNVGGRVTDADGNPVAGVEINLEDLSDTTTDAAGNYTFTNVPAGGSYLVTPSKAGLTFTPGDAVLENLSTDQSEVNFISAQAPCTAADISSQPVAQTVCAGSPASFTVTATGTNLTYQWRKNKTNIDGATSATLTFNNVSSGDTGSYDCVVSASCGSSVTSDAATLTVNPLSVSSSGESFAGSGGTGNIDISGAPTCSWTAVSNDPSFITITSGGGGSGNGTVQFSVAANAGSTIRNGTITVAGQTFTVYQGIDFADVSLNNPFYDDIGKLSARGVTLGCGNGNFCPNDPVTREQMAAFILRAKGEFDPPTPASQRFNDVPPQNVFYNFIDRLAELQITLGCTPDHLMYCPSDPVKREQMAAFLLRGLGEFDPPTPQSQRFSDVPPSNVFYSFIDRLAVLQVTLGCTPDHLLYCPSDSVTRAQMAAFLVRAFGL